LLGEPVIDGVQLGWGEDSVDYQPINPDGSVANAVDYTFQDVNRDGLPDLVGQLNTSEFTSVFLNVGPSTTSSQGSAWRSVSQNDAYGAPLPSYLANSMHVGDVDGDGIDDIVEDLDSSKTTVVLGTGSTYTTNWAAGYSQPLSPSSYGLPPNSIPIPGFITMADINGDGLVDALMPPAACQLSCTPGPSNCSFGGGPIGSQLLINNGDTWADPSGHTWLDNCTNSDALPIVVAPNATNWGNQFVDLDGDGLVDIVQASDLSGSLVSQAWLNTFHRPVINGFPNAQASPTIVDYAVITTGPAQGASSVYDDSAPIAAGQREMTSPLRVVSDIKVDAGLGPQGLKALTSYHYSSLRGSAKRGAEGFASVSTTDPLGTVTTTTYAQAYPYTGQPTSVTKSYNVGDGDARLVQYEVTNTSYCAHRMDEPDFPPGTVTTCQPAGIFDRTNTSWFVYPTQVVDTTTLETGTGADRTATNPFTTVTTTYTYDVKGNPTLTTVDTTLTTPRPNKQPPLVEEWSKTIKNDFGSDNSDNQVLGKPLTTTVTTTEVQPASPKKTHVTGFSYLPTAVAMDEIGGSPVTGIALNQVDSEVKAGYPIELFTTYGYDPFGNVTSTTACDNGEGGCRTSSVSYDPTAFVAPSGSGLKKAIHYQPGLFPVSKTNAMNQVEYLVYDPNFGVLLQDTDPNGITTCYTYDAFGHKASETDRCGSGGPIQTLYASYLPADLAAPYAAASVSVTYPPDGKTNWTYMDPIGREIETLTQSFGGALTETLTVYNPIGQVSSKTQPFFVNDQIFYIQYHYDGLNRVTLMTQGIDDIGGNHPHSVAVKQTTYQGTSTTTTESVNQNGESRTETKNAIGKVATTLDAVGGGGSYAYDSDGNLLTYTDNTTGLTQVTNQYDNRGRRNSMVDLDMGSWTYNYDGFGDVMVQSDTLSQVTTMTYDALGRMTSRTDPTGTAQWVYDSDANAPGSPTKGKLVSMIGPPDSRLLGFCTIPNIDPNVMTGNRAGKYYTYDSFGELQSVSECVDGETLTTSYLYDALGRQSTITYPQADSAPVTVGYTYTPNGFLQYVTDASNASLLWAATATNALGQVTNEYTANGVETVKGRNPSTGWLMSSNSYAQANNNQLIQSWSYEYDEAGDVLVRDRMDSLNPDTSHETFGYDLDNRLQLATASVGAQSSSASYFYDQTGNITMKDGYTYQYGSSCPDGVGAGPHAVCGVTDGSAFGYDGDGNMISGRDRVITYNPQNKVSHVESDPAVPQGNNSGSADFMYGADGNRVVQSSSTTSNGQTTTARTQYFGLGGTGHSLFESTTTSDSTQHVYYLYAGSAHGGSPFAIRVITGTNPASTSTTETRYYHHDHLGSVTAMSDESGQVVSSAWGGADATQFGYDAWGARRNPDETPATSASFNLQPGHREFTGQETIPFVSLVNLSGRVYDPTLGRFLTPDPNVQFIADPQSFNRYSYVLNNPLRYIDPTGYWSFDQWWDAHGQTIFNDALDITSGVILVGACFGTGGIGCAAAIIGVGILDSSAMHAEGASWSQAVTYTAIGEGSALVGAGLSYGLMPLDPTQATFVQSLEQGAIGGTGSAAVNVVATGHIGWDTLETIAAGALSNGVIWGLDNAGAITDGTANWGFGSGESALQQSVLFTLGGYSTGAPVEQMVDWEDPADFPPLEPPIPDYSRNLGWMRYPPARTVPGPGGQSFDPPALNPPSKQASMLPQNVGVVIREGILGKGMGALGPGGFSYPPNMSPGVAPGNQSGADASSGISSAEIPGVLATGRSSLADGFATPNDLASSPR
jgi:RHS repeat-associated protein